MSSGEFECKILRKLSKDGTRVYVLHSSWWTLQCDFDSRRAKIVCPQGGACCLVTCVQINVYEGLQGEGVGRNRVARKESWGFCRATSLHVPPNQADYRYFIGVGRMHKEPCPFVVKSCHFIIQNLTRATVLPQLIIDVYHYLDANVYQLLPLVEEYQIAEVKKKCEDFLLTKVGCMELLVTGQTYNLPQLIARCIDAVRCKSFTELQKDPFYGKLHPENLINILQLRVLDLEAATEQNRSRHRPCFRFVQWIFIRLPPSLIYN